MIPRVVVVGLGPGDRRLVSVAAIEAIDACDVRFVRTWKHPSADLVRPASSFDEVYQSAHTIEEVYGSILERLVEAAVEHGRVLYAVPGSPQVAERTVELLVADPRVDAEVVPSLSFLDLAWQRIGVDPVQAGVRLVDGHRFAQEAAGARGPLLVAQCDSRSVLSDMKLCIDDGPEVIVMQRLGLPDEVVAALPWSEIDRELEPDHLTCIWVPSTGRGAAAELVAFEELVRTLRAQCPWDREQTHQSLTRHLLEETYEVIEAIESLGTAPQGYAHLEEELGDLLFQVAFHAVLAAEQGQFGLAEVARGIHDKLVDRHPHVFGPPGTPVPDWEATKRSEKGRSSALDGVPPALPSLLYSFKLQSRAASVGFDWEHPEQVRLKILEELGELGEALRGEGDPVAELGDLLFSVVNYARHLRIDPEAALRRSAAKFRERFLAMEALAARTGRPVSDDLWDQVKALEDRLSPLESPTELEQGFQQSGRDSS